MTKRQLSIIYGSLLGDAYLDGSKKSHQCFRVEHMAKDKEYIWWKYKELKDLCNKEPKIRCRYRRGKKHCNYRFNTQCSPFFTHLRKKVFYKTGKKKITQKILSKLDRLAIAVWWQDDGNVNLTTRSQRPLERNFRIPRPRFSDYRLTFALNGFTEKEINIVIDYFRKKNINWLKYKDKNGYMLRIYRKEEIRKFMSLVRDFIHPSMTRKVINNRETLLFWQRRYSLNP